MARIALPDFDGPSPQYYSYMLKPTGNTVFGQIRSVKVDDSITVEKAGRVGSHIKKDLNKGKETTFEFEMWVDSDLEEVALLLNQTAPTSGQTIKLDPSALPSDFFIQNFDSEELTATLRSTIYMVQAHTTELSVALDEDGEYVMSGSGSLQELYWKRA